MYKNQRDLTGLHLREIKQDPSSQSKARVIINERGEKSYTNQIAFCTKNLAIQSSKTIPNLGVLYELGHLNNGKTLHALYVDSERRFTWLKPYDSKEVLSLTEKKETTSKLSLDAESIKSYIQNTKLQLPQSFSLKIIDKVSSNEFTHVLISLQTPEGFLLKENYGQFLLHFDHNDLKVISPVGAVRQNTCHSSDSLKMAFVGEEAQNSPYLASQSNKIIIANLSPENNQLTAIDLQESLNSKDVQISLNSNGEKVAICIDKKRILVCEKINKNYRLNWDFEIPDNETIQNISFNTTDDLQYSIFLKNRKEFGDKEGSYIYQLVEGQNLDQQILPQSTTFEMKLEPSSKTFYADQSAKNSIISSDNSVLCVGSNKEEKRDLLIVKRDPNEQFTYYASMEINSIHSVDYSLEHNIAMTYDMNSNTISIFEIENLEFTPKFKIQLNESNDGFTVQNSQNLEYEELDLDNIFAENEYEIYPSESKKIHKPILISADANCDNILVFTQDGKLLKFDTKSGECTFNKTILPDLIGEYRLALTSDSKSSLLVTTSTLNNVLINLENNRIKKLNSKILPTAFDIETDNTLLIFDQNQLSLFDVNTEKIMYLSHEGSKQIRHYSLNTKAGLYSFVKQTGKEEQTLYVYEIPKDNQVSDTDNLVPIASYRTPVDISSARISKNGKNVIVVLKDGCIMELAIKNT